MKKFITLLLFLTTTLTLSAQVPQAICYQAVATDTRGNELVSQSIKVRISILKGSIAGSEEWVEVHSVLTDGFGLFDLMLGNGSRVSGTQTTFNNIKWGSDKYYLKVEMDITGGTNYILMGTNQMVSVPYALYADKSGSAAMADSARIALTAITANNALSANFALTARRSDTAQFAWLADSSRRANTAISAQTAITANTAISAQTAVSAQTAITAQMAITANTARRSDTATFAWLADSSRRANTAISAQTAVSAQTAISAQTAVTAQTALDDRDRDPTNEIQSLTFDTLTSTLKLSKNNGQFDQVNFSSTPLRAPGATIEFPFGIQGEAVLVASNFTVPFNKTLFITAVNNPIVMSDGKNLLLEPGMPMIPTGKTIQSCFCSGLLIENQKYAEPIMLDFSDSNAEFTVPTGKSLILKSGTNGSRDMSFLIDGTNYSFFSGASSSPRSVVIPEGKKIRKGLTNVGSFYVTGYLLQK